MSAYVRTLLGGNIEPPTPEGYEQLINYTMLYDSGDECTDITGGWKENIHVKYGATNVSSAVKNKDSIYMGFTATKPSPTYATTLFCDNKINTVGYSKLVAILSSAYNSNTSWDKANNIVLSKEEQTNLENVTDYRKTQVAGVNFTDLSNLQNDYYLGFVVAQGSTAYCNLTFTNVFLVKPDDIYTLCKKAGLSTSTSLATLLADATSLTAIFNSEDAVNFMVTNCTGDFMVGVLNNPYCVGLLSKSPYINTVVGNPHWAKFIMMIPTAKELLGVLMLYDEGDECTDVTGGWSASDSGGTVKAYKRNNYLEIDLSGSVGYGYLDTVNAINFDDYSKMYIRYTRATASYGLQVAVGERSSDNKIITFPATKVTNKLISGDVSSKTGGNAIHIWGDDDSYFYNVFITKPDNWQTWASLGGIIATDLDSLLADSNSMATLMSNEKAVKYMVGCTGDLMVSICNSETAMNALVNNIAYEYAFAHPVWYKFMTMVPTSLSAMDSVAVTVPTMTSNTAPSGVASASSTFNATYDAYKAFDNSQNTYWSGAQTATAIDSWIAYTWSEKLYLYKVNIMPPIVTKYRGDLLPTEFKIQGLNDSGEWVDIETFKTKTTTEQTSNFTDTYIMSDTSVAYIGFRIYATGNATGGTNGSNLGFGEVDFYGKAVN